MKIVLIQLIICALILECVAYFFLTHTHNALYRARRILQTDDISGWRQQSNLSTEFENSPLFTDDNGFRVTAAGAEVAFAPDLLVLGPSSAFGWGVSFADTYSAILARNLKMKLWNTSQIGYSSEQGRQIWESSIKPKLKNIQSVSKFALIAYGVNDLDKFRFYNSIFLAKFERHSNFITFLSLALSEAQFHYDCSSLAHISQRVETPRFVSNISLLIEELRKENYMPILINTPYLFAGDIESATNIEELYRKVEAAAQKQNCSAALELLSDAKNLEPARVARDVQLLNSQIETIGKTLQVPVVQANAILAQGASTSNFVDPVHPSPKGHELIARQISEIVLKLKSERK